MDRRAHSFPSSAKIERRIVEKNRRNNMKILYARLNSLLPNKESKDVAVTLPDQIDEAINYIKLLEIKLNVAKEKKERLLGKRASGSTAPTSSSAPVGSCSSSPQLKVREIGTVLEVVFTSGLENQFLFYEIIRILHQESAEIVNASYSATGNSVFHTVHAEIGGPMLEFGGAKVKDRLMSLVYGSTSDMEMQTKLWDLEFNPHEIWASELWNELH